MSNSQNAQMIVSVNALMAVVLPTAIAFLTAVWVITSWTMGNVRDDISDIRSHLTKTQQDGSDTRRDAQTADSQFSAEIAALIAELKTTNARLSDLQASVGELDNSIKTVDVRLSQSIERQVNFERWVALKLASDQQSNAIPSEWQKAWNELTPTLAKGSDPFQLWYKFSAQ